MMSFSTTWSATTTPTAKTFRWSIEPASPANSRYGCRDMAMRIGEQYSSERVTLRDFEKLAEDAKLGRPLVRERLTQVTERVRAALPNVPATNPVAEQMRDLIRTRSEKALTKFRGR